MRKQLIVLASALLLAAPAFGFGLFSSTPLARMGDVKLSAEQLKELINAQTPEVRTALLSRKEVLEELINKELLRRSLIEEAKKAEWDKRPEVIVAMERAREQSLMDAWLAASSAPDPAWPGAEELLAAYNANKAAFTQPGQVRLAQILLRLPQNATKEQIARINVRANEIVQRLDKGTPFSSLVILHSQDEESSKKEGDLGWIPEANLLPQLRTAISQLKPGEHTPPLQTAFGIQIIRLSEQQPATVRTLEEVRAMLTQAMRQQRAKENREKTIENLRTRSPVSIDEKQLKSLGE